MRFRLVFIFSFLSDNQCLYQVNVDGESRLLGLTLKAHFNFGNDDLQVIACEI